MKIKYDLAVILVFILVTIQVTFAQELLPILKTSTKTLSIKEGTVFRENVWTIDTELKLDEFVTNKFETEQTLSFYSDIDTLTFSVHPNKHYDFVIQLNKEKAYTRISTDFNKSPSLKILSFYHKDNKVSNTDTIPFKIFKNRIYISGQINNSENLNLLFDTGAGANVVSSSIINKKVKMMLDGETENLSAVSTSIVETSSNNNLKVSNLIWDNVEFISINYKNRPFDGIIGWPAFEGKVVEIDYDNQNLIIHNSQPIISNDYSKLKTKMIDGVPYIWGQVSVNQKEAEGWFLFDTGADGVFNMSQEFANRHSFRKFMKPTGKATHSGSNGTQWTSTIYLLPKLKLGEYETYLVPVFINDVDSKEVTPHENLGNNILKRFNVLFDLNSYTIYLKPNNLIHSSYSE